MRHHVLAFILAVAFLVAPTAATAAISDYSYSGDSYDFTSQGNSGRQALTFSSDGTYMYLTDGFSGNKIYQYTLGNPWDITSATYTRQATASTTGLTGVRLSTDGTKLYHISFYSSGSISEYTLSTPWNISTMGNRVTKTISSGNHYTTAFKDDGTALYAFNSHSGKIERYSMSSAWDLSTLGSSPVASHTVVNTYYMFGAAFTENGERLYLLRTTTSGSTPTLREYSLPTPWDISTATTTQADLSVTSESSVMYGLAMNETDESLFTLGQSTGARKVFRYESSASDITAPVISSVASSTTHGTATITWSTDEAATSSVSYGLTNSYGSASSSVALATSHSISLSGLSPNTLYHFEVANADANGNTVSSSDYTFTTSAAPDTTPPVLSAATITLDATSAAISWTSDELADARFGYGTTSTYSVSTTSTALRSNHLFSIFNLLPGTTYHYQYGSSDASDNLASSTDATFTTDTLLTESDVDDDTPTHRSTSVSNRIQNLMRIGMIERARELALEFNKPLPASAEAVTVTTKPIRDLELGVEGEDVVVLQKYLIASRIGNAAEQLSVIGATGYFGTYTRRALVEYQQNHDINPAQGYYGPLTRARVRTLTGKDLYW